MNSMTTPSSGEAKLKRRERLTLALVIAGFIGGFVIGLGLALGTDGPMFAAETNWPPTLALAAVAFFVIVVGTLVVIANKEADELERGHQAKGFEAAMWALLFAYPSWYTLWKGGHLPEPSHEILFLGTFIAAMAGYLFHRLR